MENLRTYRLSFAILLTTLLCAGVGFHVVSAEKEDVSEVVNTLNDTINEKKESIEQINRQIKEYQKKIDQKQSERASLSVELELIENRIAKTQLEIEETNTEIELVNTELRLVEHELEILEGRLARDRELIISVLQEMQVSDHSLPLQVLFGTDSFSTLFDQIDQLGTINNELQDAVTQIKASQASMENKKDSQLTKLGQLDDLRENLKREVYTLDESVEAQVVLISETRQSESEFQALLRELKQEQQFIDQQIAVLQSEIEGKLAATDQGGDSSVLSWPFAPPKGVSAYFHDTTYPFRHLFEHSGVDLPAAKGTAVKSAAAGYVAWTRVGRQYGNYIMVIHANGVATLYAHLSRIDVKPDEFVARGKVIGAVGSTGLSTGPHLHFEVRKNGIPTNPLNYLIAQ